MTEISDGNCPGPELLHLGGKEIDVLMRGQTHNTEALRKTLDNFESTCSDRSRRAKDGDVLNTRPLQWG